VGWDYFTHGRYIEETNDAQIAADTLAVSPRISGYVAQVLVQDNQDVKAGTPLITLDPRDYKAKTAQASAQVAIAQAWKPMRRPPLPNSAPASNRPAPS
jgi:membrane fusion protein (multidrug efflux system)